MSVLTFKPHRLSYLVTEIGYEDANGDFHEGKSYWDGNIPCDAVISGSANEIRFEDGSTHRYSYTIYLPKDCREFFIGDKVRVTLLGARVREFSVLGFARYQHQCKLWV